MKLSLLFSSVVMFVSKLTMGKGSGDSGGNEHGRVNNILRTLEGECWARSCLTKLGVLSQITKKGA